MFVFGRCLSDVMWVLSIASRLRAVTFFLSRADLKGMWFLCTFSLEVQQRIEQAVIPDVFVVARQLGDMM